MPSVNVMRNINLAIDRRGRGSACPNTSAYPVQFCGTPDLDYTALSLDEVNQKWYPTNAEGFFTPDTGSTAGTITGSAALIKLIENGCPYPAVYLSGSLTVPLSGIAVNIGIVSGSFSLIGNNPDWDVLVATGAPVGYTGSYIDSNFGVHYILDNQSVVNNLVGIKLSTFVGPFDERTYGIYVSGSLIASNPPNWPSGPYSLGDTLTISGEGIIRTFGTPEGTTEQQSQYNCLYGTS
jgi:hypothetical protein